MDGDEEQRYECPRCKKPVNSSGQGHMMQCVLFGRPIPAPPPPPSTGKTGVLTASGPRTRCPKCGNMVDGKGVGHALKCQLAGQPVPPPS